MDTFLGIDGGASRTRARLVDADGNELAYAESGASNLNANRMKTVRISLSEVIQHCLQASKQAPTATCLGIAGVSAAGTKEKLETILQSHDIKNYRITSDAEIALEGAFTGGPGILLISGTGSICLGKSSDGRIVRSGGWGWIADDAGSAGWIGQRALEAAVQQNDGRMEGRALRDAVFEMLDISDDGQISSKIYQPTLNRSDIAQLAPCVLKLANQDDVAKHILDQALEELKKLVQATAKQLANEVQSVVFTGGVLDNNPDICQMLESKLTGFNVQQAEADSLQGAVALARQE